LRRKHPLVLGQGRRSAAGGQARFLSGEGQEAVAPTIATRHLAECPVWVRLGRSLWSSRTPNIPTMQTAMQRSTPQQARSLNHDHAGPRRLGGGRRAMAQARGTTLEDPTPVAAAVPRPLTPAVPSGGQTRRGEVTRKYVGCSLSTRTAIRGEFWCLP
jgi:hypothetical protein